MQSRLTPSIRPLSQTYVLRVIAIRLGSSTSANYGATCTPNLPRPPTAKIQLQPPAGEKGHWHYERMWSRDGRWAAQPGHYYDTVPRFFTNTFKYEWGLYPAFAIFSGLFLFTCFVIHYSFRKIECQVDRSQKIAPWDWERARNNYWKLPTRFMDPHGYTHNRLAIMEQLQDEMMEAAHLRNDSLPMILAHDSHWR